MAGASTASGGAVLLCMMAMVVRATGLPAVTQSLDGTLCCFG